MGIGSSKEEDETATFDKHGNPTNEAADNVVKGITDNVRQRDLTNAATTLMEDLKQVGEAEDNVEQKKAQLKVDTETATRLANFAGETEGAGGAVARAKKAAAWAAGKVAGKVGLGGKARRDESPSKPTGGGGRKKRKIQSKTKKRRIQSKTKKRRIQSKTKKRRIQSKTKKRRIQSKTKKR